MRWKICAVHEYLLKNKFIFVLKFLRNIFYMIIVTIWYTKRGIFFIFVVEIKRSL